MSSYCFNSSFSSSKNSTYNPTAKKKKYENSITSSITKEVITKSIIATSEFGLAYASIESLKGGDVSLNKQIFSDVLQGRATTPQRDVVALNTALVLWVAGFEDDLNEGFNKALFSISQGDPWIKFLLLKNYLRN